MAPAPWRLGPNERYLRVDPGNWLPPANRTLSESLDPGGRSKTSSDPYRRSRKSASGLLSLALRVPSQPSDLWSCSVNRRDTALALLVAALIAPLPARSARSADGAGAPAQEASVPLDAYRKRVVVETLATSLEQQYVFPEVGSRYAARLREQLRRGAYEDLADALSFATQVNGDLQTVFPDRHLAIVPSRRTSRRGPDPTDAPQSTKASGARGLEDARMIGDVAYLRFNEFPGDASAATARSFLLAHADARAVVIDSRPNRGGRLDEMNAILPLLVSRPTRLYRMEMRAGAASPFESVPMVRRVAGTKSLQR